MADDVVLVVLCGLSFSGKSTLAGALGGLLPAEVLAFDEINLERGLRSGQGVPLEEWVRTKEVAHARAVALLASGTSVVVDDTASPRFLRDEWRALARRAGARTVVVHVTVDAELQRTRIRATREHGDRPDVLDPILEEHRAAFEAPTADEEPLVFDGADAREHRAIAALAARIDGAGTATAG